MSGTLAKITFFLLSISCCTQAAADDSTLIDDTPDAPYSRNGSVRIYGAVSAGEMLRHRYGTAENADGTLTALGDAEGGYCIGSFVALREAEKLHLPKICAPGRETAADFLRAYVKRVKEDDQRDWFNVAVVALEAEYPCPK